MHATISPAQQSDALIIAQVLREAACWLRDIGKPLWNPEHFTEEGIVPETPFYYVVGVNESVAGVFKLEETDRTFWPDVAPGNSLFIHKIAIRRSFAGLGLSSTVLEFAVREAEKRGKEFLRLDCDANRPPLRALYERFGFDYHSQWQAGSFLCARYEYKMRSKKR